PRSSSCSEREPAAGNRRTHRTGRAAQRPVRSCRLRPHRPRRRRRPADRVAPPLPPLRGDPMNAYHIQPGGGLDTLRPVTLPDPEPGPDEVLIRVRANSLNYRDTLILHGRYGRTAPGPLIPLSDGAGEIIAVGANVEGFRHGDRIAGNFMRRWAGGRPDE